MVEIQTKMLDQKKAPSNQERSLDSINKTALMIAQKVVTVKWGTPSRSNNFHNQTNNFNQATDAGKWDVTEGSLEDLANHIKTNRTWMSSILDREDGLSKRRSKVVSNTTYVLAIDIDNSQPIYDDNGKRVVGEKIKADNHFSMQDMENHPFFKLYGGLIQPSKSHTEDWHRYRVVFALQRAITTENGGQALIERCYNYLACNIFGTSKDDSILDVSKLTAENFWYGSKHEPYFLDVEKALPEDFLETVKSWVSDEEVFGTSAKTATTKKKKTFKQLEVDYLLAQKALEYIPKRKEVPNSYPHCIKVAQGLFNHFGFDDALELLEDWCPSGDYEREGSKSSGAWDNEAKLKSFQKDHPFGVNFGSVLYLAVEFSGGEFDPPTAYQKACDELGFSIEDLPEYLRKTQEPIPTKEEIAEIIKDSEAKKPTEPEDNFDLFHPEFSKLLKEKADYHEMKGSSFVFAAAVAPLMAGISPITLVGDSKNNGRTAYPTTLTVGDTAAGKSLIATDLLSSGTQFLKQIDSDSLKLSYDALRHNVVAETRPDIIDKIQEILPVNKNRRCEEILEVTPFMLDNTSSSKQGSDRAIGFLAKGIELRKLSTELDFETNWFHYCFEHPIFMSLDEGSDYLNRFYSGKTDDHQYSCADVNQWKSLKRLEPGLKRLSKGSLRTGELPRTMNISIQYNWLKSFLEKNKFASDGFTGRWLFSLLTSPEKPYQVKIDNVNLAEKNSELKLLVLGATIVNYTLALRVNDIDRPHRDIFNMPINIEHGVFKDCCEEIAALQDEIVAEYPDWANLTKDIAAKTNHFVYEMSPQLKRFNYGVEIFLKRIKEIFGDRPLSDLLAIVEDTAQGDLIRFAKVLFYNLPDGGTFKHKSGKLKIVDILFPEIIINGVTKALRSDLENSDLYQMSLTNQGIETLGKELSETDVLAAKAVTLNSLKSYQKCLRIFENIDSCSMTIEGKASRARAEEILMKSNGDDGVNLKTERLFKALASKQCNDKSITISVINNNDRTFKALHKSNKEEAERFLNIFMDLLALEGLVEASEDKANVWKRTKKVITTEHHRKVLEAMKKVV